MDCIMPLLNCVSLLNSAPPWTVSVSFIWTLCVPSLITLRTWLLWMYQLADGNDSIGVGSNLCASLLELLDVKKSMLKSMYIHTDWQMENILTEMTHVSFRPPTSFWMTVHDTFHSYCRDTTLFQRHCPIWCYEFVCEHAHVHQIELSLWMNSWELSQTVFWYGVRRSKGLVTLRVCR